MFPTAPIAESSRWLRNVLPIHAGGGGKRRVVGLLLCNTKLELTWHAHDF